MTAKKMGQQTAELSSPPSFLSFANAGGHKEGEGPLKNCFDILSEDDTFGESSWEKSESAMQKQAFSLALEKGGLQAEQLDWLFAGDLLNQCVSSTFAARGQNIPFFSLCSLFAYIFRQPTEIAEKEKTCVLLRTQVWSFQAKPE